MKESLALVSTGILRDELPHLLVVRFDEHIFHVRGELPFCHIQRSSMFLLCVKIYIRLKAMDRILELPAHILNIFQ